MKIKEVTFVKSSDHISTCPKPVKGEFAFIGRSNVGKSSLINMLMDRKKLAKISSTPGKTQLINHFLVNDKWYLVDLPGYGWAKASKDNKAKWEKMIRSYLLNRKNLALVFILIDVRLPPQEIDTEFIDWMGQNQIPFMLIFTKIDKLSKNKTQGAIQKYRHVLSKNWDQVPDMIASSSVNGDGKDSIMEYIEDVLKEIPF
jgi:GTP-binding protein